MLETRKNNTETKTKNKASTKPQLPKAQQKESRLQKNTMKQAEEDFKRKHLTIKEFEETKDHGIYLFIYLLKYL